MDTKPKTQPPPAQGGNTAPLPPDNPVLDAVFGNCAFNLLQEDANRVFKVELPALVGTEFKPPPDDAYEEIVRYIKVLPPVHRVKTDVFVDFILPAKRLIARSELEKLGTLPMAQAMAGAALGTQRPSLKSLLEAKDTVELKNKVDQLPQAEKEFYEDQMKFVQKLRGSTTKPGLNVKQDITLGNTSSVFATLGFNNHGINGGPVGDGVIIILSQGLVHHPGTTISPCAGTSFLSKRAFYHQPWQYLHLKSHGFKDADIKSKILEQLPKKKEEADIDFPLVSENMAIDCYVKSLLHPSQEGWAELAALQLQYAAQIHRTRATGKNLSVGNDYIINQYYHTTNGHGVFECHLPIEVPFYYFEKIFFPKNEWNPTIEAACKSAGILDKIFRVDSPVEAQRLYFVELFEECKKLSTQQIPNGYWLSIHDRKRIPLWLPHAFKTPGKATITFTVRGQHIRLMFSDDKDISNLNKDVYLFCIGVTRNTETYLKRKVGEGAKRPYVHSDDSLQAMGSPQDWGDYWISIDQGDIHFGRGTDITKNEVSLMKFKDPHPILFKYLSVSCWESGVEFRNLRLFD